MKKIHVDGCVTQEIIEKVRFLMSDAKHVERIMAYLYETEPIFMKEVSKYIRSSLDTMHGPPPPKNDSVPINGFGLEADSISFADSHDELTEKELREITELVNELDAEDEDESNETPNPFQTSKDSLLEDTISAALIFGFLIARESIHILFKDMVDIDALLPRNE